MGQPRCRSAPCTLRVIMLSDGRKPLDISQLFVQSLRLVVLVVHFAYPSHIATAIHEQIVCRKMLELDRDNNCLRPRNVSCLVLALHRSKRLHRRPCQTQILYQQSVNPVLLRSRRPRNRSASLNHAIDAPMSHQDLRPCVRWGHFHHGPPLPWSLA